MITDQIGLHKRLLQLNHNYNKMCDILGFFKIKNARNSASLLLVVKKKTYEWTIVMVHAVQLFKHDTTVLFVVKSVELVANWI